MDYQNIRLEMSGADARLILLGDKLPAQQAADWGLIWKCVDAAAFDEEIERLVRYFAKAPTRGLARTKQAIYASAANTLEKQLDLERDFMRELAYTRDYREAVRAFMEKRDPLFKGE